MHGASYALAQQAVVVAADAESSDGSTTQPGRPEPQSVTVP